MEQAGVVKKPRKSAKLAANNIGAKIQTDLHRKRLDANRAIKKNLLLLNDYKKAYEILDEALKQVMFDVVPLCVVEVAGVSNE